jgi:hypothetical protein
MPGSPTSGVSRLHRHLQLPDRDSAAAAPVLVQNPQMTLRGPKPSSSLAALVLCGLAAAVRRLREDSLNPALGQTWRYGVGTQYQITKSINIGLSEALLWSGDMSVDQGSKPEAQERVGPGPRRRGWRRGVLGQFAQAGDPVKIQATPPVRMAPERARNGVKSVAGFWVRN